jgi:AcrR family transcriptional regulator
MTRSAPSEASRPLKRRGAPVVDRVLDVALEALAEQGFHGFSVPAVAERAGLNKTSVYRRWPTKTALVSAALERALGHRAQLPDTGSLREDVLAFAQGAVAFVTSPVGRAVMRTLLADADHPEVRELAASMLREQTNGPRAIFRRAQARGELARDADVTMALTVVAGAIVHRTFIEHGALTPAFVTRLVTLVVDGLCAKAP